MDLMSQFMDSPIKVPSNDVEDQLDNLRMENNNLSRKVKIFEVQVDDL